MLETDDTQPPHSVGSQHRNTLVVPRLLDDYSVQLPAENSMADSNVKVVVITGCSSGIGLDTAVLLAKEKNFKVLATMRNLQKKGDLEKAAAGTLNKTLFIQELDVSKEESIEKFVKATYDSEGRIDVLINNAASGQHGHFESVTLEQMQSLFQTNVFGTLRITQEVVKKMKERKSGHIIFISSIGGITPFPFTDFYIGTKFAIEGIAGSMAPLLRHYNIFVTCVEPGPVQTSITTNISKNNQGGITERDEVDVDAGVDDFARNQRKKFVATFVPFMQQIMQTGEDVGQVIKNCICSEKPSLRVQTSDAMKQRAKAVLVDPSGDKMTDELEKLLQ
ncbi:retinol dehydrogenase 8-like [Apostichopus japonicus]|uniref:retinol dehydrogenase 8-like n=1 Tax=Stichopus japonicus TaxID=307972 RepID=UPI003AB6D04E